MTFFLPQKAFEKICGLVMERSGILEAFGDRERIRRIDPSG